MRHLKTIDMGSQILYRIQMTTDDCDKNTQQSHFLLCELLRNLSENPNLIACGFTDPEKVVLIHDGHRWCLEAEAFVQKEGV